VAKTAKTTTAKRPIDALPPRPGRSADGHDDRGGRAGGPTGSKLAARLADRIVGEITELGWPSGEVVGTEPELLDRYGVSRAVFREAVRLLEHLQVARMRRGPGGGLMVTPPSVDSVTDAVSVYLFYIGAEIDEVFEARLALEEVATELAPLRVDEPQIEELRALVQREQGGEVRDHRELHNLVATISGNPALAFFVDLLNRVTLLYLPAGSHLSRQTLEESAHAHAAIVRALLADEPGLARNRMRKHLLAEAEYLRSRRPSRHNLADLPDLVGRSPKRAEQIARQIFREVAAAGWPVGQLLGSEPELIERYDVSRAVLREAVRVLEHHQVAYMRRGPGGGLFVAEPGVEAVSDAVALHVNRLGIRPQHLMEVRSAVEMAMLQLAVQRLDDQGAARLRRALEAEEAATKDDFLIVGHDLHAVLAGLTGNRVIELLVLVLVRLQRFHGAVPPEVTGGVSTREVIDVHGRIVEAILARDLDLARHRLRRHLDALARWAR
jgi:DNA-binding FadR family transcriptional regulator